MNDTLFFTANDGINGNELWKSDGTSGGTVMVKDINEGGSFDPNGLTLVNGTLYFSANDGVHGDKLWKSDGTAAGTVLVKDTEVLHNPHDFINVNGKLYFGASGNINNVNYGDELWSLGTCTDANSIVSNFNKTLYYNSQKQVSSENITCQCDLFNKLISTTEATGTNPVSGEIDTKVWIEEAASGAYVRRHYEIIPATDANTATGRITLYFTQDDFDAYYNTNPARTVNLPIDPSDINGIKHIRIEKRAGNSSDGTGLPETYSGNITIIDPLDEDIFWNEDKQRWAVSFATTGFGGFFVKSTDVIEPTEVSVNTTEICLGSSVSLTATCTAGTIKWYNQASAGEPIGTGSPLLVSLNDPTTYYAACESGEFSSSRIATSTVMVYQIPEVSANPVVDKTAIVSGAFVTLTATCSIGNVV